MSPHEVINRGFGGAHITHINNHFHEVVAPYEPKGIVFFCGTNDLAALNILTKKYSIRFIKNNLNKLFEYKNSSNGFRFKNFQRLSTTQQSKYL